MSFELVQRARVAPYRFTACVVPTAIGATALDLRIGELTGAMPTFLDFVRGYFLPDMHAMVDARTIRTTTTVPAGERAIIFAIVGNPVLSGAPSRVTSRVATIPADSPQSFVVTRGSATDANSSFWIVARRIEGLRHAAYTFLKKLGARYLAPSPRWKVLPRLDNHDIGDIDELFTPAFRSWSWNGEGGLGSLTQPPSGPQGTREPQIRDWDLWFRQLRTPLEFIGGAADGDEGFVQWNQCWLREDKSRLAWTESAGLRGYSVSGAFPATCYDASTAYLAKVCDTNNGPSPTSVPTDGGSATPWVGVARPTKDCSASPNVPCSTTPDPLADTGIYPYDPNDYTGWGGVYAKEAVYHFQVISERITQFGTGHPNVRWVSTEQHDGGNLCECSQCLGLLRRGPYAAYVDAADCGIKATGSSAPAVTGAGIVGAAANFKVKITNSTHFDLSLDGGATYPNTNITIPNGSTFAFSTIIGGNALVLTFPAGTYAFGHEYTLADASPSDHNFFNSNRTQWNLAYKFRNAGFIPGCGMFAYVTHVMTPSIPIEPNTLTHIIRTSNIYLGGYSEEELLEQWVEKRDNNQLGPFTLSSDQFVLTDTLLFGSPKWPPPLVVAGRIHDQIVRGFEAQTTQTGYSGLNIGPHFYVSSELLWDRDRDETELLRDWFTDGLGKAAEPIRQMYYRWWDWYEHTQHEIAVSFRNVLAAQIALNAASDPVGCDGVDPRGKVQNRLNDCKAVVQWHRYITEYRQAHATFQEIPSVAHQNALLVAIENIYSWGWRIESLNLIHVHRVAHEIDQLIEGRLSTAIGKGFGGGGTAKQGTSTAEITLSGVANSTVSMLRIEIDGAGLVGIATFRWSKNGGTTWETPNHVPTSATAISLAGTGITVAFPGGSTDYTPTMAWIQPAELYRKWDRTNVSAPCGWSTIVPPNQTELDTALLDGLASYTPVPGVTRRTWSQTYQALAPSGLTTTTQGWWQYTGLFTSYILRINGTTTVQIRYQSGGVGPDQVVRVLLLGLDGSVVQTQTFPRSGNTGGVNILRTITFTGVTNGFYRLRVQAPRCSDSYRMETARNVQIVQLHDQPEAAFYNTIDPYNDAKRVYFYVPTGETAVVMAFRSGTTIQFYDETGAPVTTFKDSYYQWRANVASGHDGKVWSFTGLKSNDSDGICYIENCPNLFTWSPEHVIIPAEAA